MGSTTVTAQALLPEAELARIARVLARFLSGHQASLSGTQAMGRVSGQGVDFLDFRQYLPGDDFRTIDWRASARSNKIQVRQYCGDLASDWYLCLDASASMGVQGGANWLLARQLTAALAYLLLHLGHRVSLLLFSSEIDVFCSPGRGHGQYARILGLLNNRECRASGGGSDLGACAARVGRGRSLMVVSDFLTRDAMLPALVKLQASQRQLHLFQLGAVPHWQLPEADTLLLKDVESGRTAMCGAPENAQQDARRRLDALQQELVAWCVRYRVPLTHCNGDDNWRDLLLRHFIRA
jgi:uncharacterized protein (DUF58 family)